MSTVTVMFGPSGSGKSTWLQQNRPKAVVCSADHWFMRGGVYRWSAGQMEQAHLACMRKFLEHLMLEDRPDLAVDNAFTAAFGANPYIQAGLAMGARVEIMVMSPPGGWSPETILQAHARNRHGVPLSTVASAAERLNLMLTSWASYLPTPVIIRPDFPAP